MTSDIKHTGVIPHSILSDVWGWRGRGKRPGVDLTEPTLSNQIGEERQWWWVVVGGLQVRVTIKNPLQYINSQNYSTGCTGCLATDYSLFYLLFKMRGKEQRKEITSAVITAQSSVKIFSPQPSVT